MKDKPLPLMQVGFLPFLLATITDYATVYTATKNFLNVVGQLKQQILPLFCELKQQILPLFCDEGVFRTVAHIYLIHK